MLFKEKTQRLIVKKLYIISLILNVYELGNFQFLSFLNIILYNNKLNFQFFSNFKLLTTFNF